MYVLITWGLHVLFPGRRCVFPSWQLHYLVHTWITFTRRTLLVTGINEITIIMSRMGKKTPYHVFPSYASTIFLQVKPAAYMGMYFYYYYIQGKLFAEYPKVISIWNNYKTIKHQVTQHKYESNLTCTYLKWQPLLYFILTAVPPKWMLVVFSLVMPEVQRVDFIPQLLYYAKSM